MADGRFDNLASFRGSAAFVVFLAHLVTIHLLRFAGLGSPLHQISSVMSEYAVLVFFVISGFLIAHSLEVNAARDGRLKLGVFLAARFARLYPPLLFGIAISLLVYMVMQAFGLPGRNGPLRLAGDIFAVRDVIHVGVMEVLGAAAMVQGMLDINGPLWSLFMEAKLYVLFACALGWILSPRRIVLLPVFVFCVWLGLRYNPGFAGYAVIWLIGSVSYYLCNRSLKTNNRLILCGVLILAFSLIEVFYSREVPHFFCLLRCDGCVFLAPVPKKHQITGRGASGRLLLQPLHHAFSGLVARPVLADSLGNSLLVVSLLVSIVSGTIALIVAWFGGLIEARKSTIQSLLIAGGAFIWQQVMRYVPTKFRF